VLSTGAHSHTVTVSDGRKIQESSFSNIMAIIDGRLEEALALSRRFVARSDELGASLRGWLFNVQLVLQLLLYLGRASE
jgi:hypothetical protein